MAANVAPPSRPRILVLAFGFGPGQGSELGAGWAIARMAAGLGETWVLLRAWPSTPERLRAEVRSVPEADRLHLVFVDQPFIAGHLPATDDYGWERVEYLLWQFRALRVARRIARRERIDLVWHASWSTAWLGSVGGFVGPTFVWGPIGGGTGTPWRLLPALGPRGVAVELARSFVRTAFRWLNPLVYLAAAKADLILAQNADTARWLPRSARSRTEVFHRIAIDERDLEFSLPGTPMAGRGERGERPPTALFAGRLLAWKGAWLAVEAIALLDGWRLLIVGDGPDAARLRRLAEDRGIAERVEFRSRVERSELLRIMRAEADVFLFPSLHEEGGWVVGEAVAVGLPVVCVDRGGPPTVAGQGVEPGSPAQTAERLAAAVLHAYTSPDAAPEPPTLERRRNRLAAILRRREIVPGDVPGA